MAENVIDALLVTLGIDSSEYQQGMEEAERTTRDFSERAPREAERGLNQIEQKFGMTFKGIFRSFIAPLTAALGTMGVFSSYTQTADRIGKTAARIGASAEELQAWGEAAKRSGGSVEGFIASFESLNGQIQRMQAMGGKGRLTPLLKQLGISPTENGQAKDTFRILRDLSDAAERVGKDKFAGTAKFFGLDSGTIALLQQGRVAMDELIKRQKELGVYTKQDFEITAKFNDSLSDLQQTFRMLAAPILRVITPALSTLADWLTKIGQTFREHQGFIVAGLTVIAAAMSGTLLKAALALGAALKPLLVPIAAIAALGLVFDDFATYAKGGESALRGLWAAFGTPKELQESAQAVTKWAADVWDTVSNVALDIAAELIVAFNDWVNSIDVDALKNAFAPVLDIFKPLQDLFKTVWGLAKNLFGLLGDLVGEVDQAFNAEPGSGWYVLKNIVEAISLTIQAMEHLLKQLFGWIDEKITQLRNFLKFGSEDVSTAKKQVLNGRDEKQVIAQKAEALKKENPALTEEQAVKKAGQQFRQEVGEQQAKNAAGSLAKQVEADNSAAYLFGDPELFKSLNKTEPDTVTRTPVAARAPDVATAAVANRAPDVKNFTQTNNSEKTTNIRVDQNITNNIQGVERAQDATAAIGNAAKDATSQAIHLAAFDAPQQG